MNGGPRPARLRVGVVGVGRVGGTLGAALARAGHEVVAAAAVSARSVRRAQDLLPGAAILPLDEVVAAAELVLLAVPDDVLRPLVSGLAEADVWRPGQLVAHTSGASGIGVLDPAAARGVLALALHPVMTFAGRPEDLDRLDGAAFGVTAPDELRVVAESLVLEMGGEPVWVPEPARALYHAALTVGANHLVTLVNDSVTMLSGAGVAEPARLVAPLLSAALDNVLRLGDSAITGPVSRGDVATVVTHLRTLERSAPETLEAYRAMARRTAVRARDAGLLSTERAAEVLGVLVKVVRTRDDFESARATLAAPVGLVPTMGALHAGHAALLHTARADCASVVTTNFVNPLQFGPGEDLARYPRTLDADLAVCEREGVDLVWAPGVDDVYPHGGSQTTVQPGPLGDQLEGAARPGHFAGVLTVVAKFLGLVRPDRAYFGEKDYQQLTIIRQMVRDLELRVDVCGVPTVREPDGLALSSRNVFLSVDERDSALALSRALRSGAAADGALGVIAAATTVLAASPGLAVDYLELRDVDLGEVPERGEARLLVAARVGATRLIDNVPVRL